MKKCAKFIATALVLTLAVEVFAASIVNGSFEYGLAGWSKVYNGGGIYTTSVYTGDGGSKWYPQHGSKFAVLRAGNTNKWVHIYQNFTCDSHGELKFSWFYDSWEPLYRVYIDKYNDQAQGGINSYTIFNIDSKDVGASHSSGGGTSWKQESIYLPAGNYTIWFAVKNDDDYRYDSHLGVDKVELICRPDGKEPPDLAVIPEPMTMFGVLAGIGGLVGYIRKRM